MPAVQDAEECSAGATIFPLGRPHIWKGLPSFAPYLSKSSTMPACVSRDPWIRGEERTDVPVIFPGMRERSAGNTGDS